MPIDEMLLMRGVDRIEQLWERRQRFVAVRDEAYKVPLPDVRYSLSDVPSGINRVSVYQEGLVGLERFG